MMKQIIIIGLLASMSLTVYGQDFVSPVQREISGTDTFTVFTIEDEREILSRLKRALDEQKELNLQRLYNERAQKAMAYKDSIIYSLQVEVHTYGVLDNNNQSIIDLQDQQINQCLSENEKLKRQRKLMSGGILVLLAASILGFVL